MKHNFLSLTLLFLILLSTFMIITPGVKAGLSFEIEVIASEREFYYHGHLNVLSHELGHMYSFTPPSIYGVECPLYCKPLATYLGIEAVAAIYGPNARLWYWGTHPGFFDYIGGDRSVGNIERMQFVFFYLHRVYGAEIHKQFIQLWANNTVLKDKLMSKGFNLNEVMIVLYSYLAGKNLAWLFQMAGYNVSEQRIDYGLKLILIETPNYLVNGVKKLWSEHVPGPILILDKQTIPIVSGDKNAIPIPSVVAVAREFGKGRVVAASVAFFTNKALDLFDNKVFARNIIEWLSRLEGRKILISLGHREWIGGSNEEHFKQMLENLGYSVTRYYGSLTPEVLSQFNILLIGIAWGNFTQNEVSAILNFVKRGGGLLLNGLGWSWPGSTLDNYPMNILGEHFGFRWIDFWIEDPDPEDNYEGLPIFSTFYPNIEIGSIPQAISYIDEMTKKYAGNLPYFIESVPDTRWKYFAAHELLVSASLNLRTDSPQRTEIYNFYKYLFTTYPQLYGKNITYNINTQSTMAWIRERTYFSFVNTLLLHRDGLTAQTIKEIAEVLRLDGKYLDLWMDFQVMMLDNHMLSTTQLDFIYHYLSHIPRELHNLRFISVIDFLGPLPSDVPTRISSPFIGYSRLTQRFGNVNIFGIEVGIISENGFPEDVEPYWTDVFSIVVVHEVNHVVDAYYISRNSTLSERRGMLISRAGHDHINYLRSILPDGFFVQSPQEFFASIANQWFANTSHTLKLALVRFDKGYREPLNQFLFFADVYSRGGKTTFFYTIDIEGNIQRKEVLVQRDGQGRITGLVDGKIVYKFILDSNGSVTSYFASLDKTPPTTGHNYNGLWHSSDITIVLNSSDDLSGVAEIFYRVNNGSVKRVSVDGQPFITTEGANNMLEYWSVDNAGNEEPHRIITNIKLDKTPPTVNIEYPQSGLQIRNATVVVRWYGLDKISGINHYEVRLNGGVWVNLGLNTDYVFHHLHAGSHNICVKAIDNAGNINIACVKFIKTEETTTYTATITTTITTTTIPTTTATSSTITPTMIVATNTTTASSTATEMPRFDTGMLYLVIVTIVVILATAIFLYLRVRRSLFLNL